MKAGLFAKFWRLSLAGLVIAGLAVAPGCKEDTKAKTTKHKAPGDATPTTTEPAEVPYVALDIFQAAARVLGQVNFTAKTSNQSGPPAATTLNIPYQTRVSASGELVIADDANYRVLHFASAPITDDGPADLAIGQANLTSMVPASTAAGFGLVNDAFLNSNGLVFVADTSNNRVLIYFTTPTASGVAADRALGQVDLISNSVGPCDSSGLDAPSAVIEVDGRLIVSDTNHSRVLIWSTVPVSNNQAANVVVGQNSFSTCFANDDDQVGGVDASPTSRTLDSPTGIWSDGTKLVVADWGNHRVLIWNSFPATNFQPADVVLGQVNMFGSSSGISALALNAPFHIDSNGTQLAVADSQNNRVLIWNSFPGTDGQAADVVLGQGDFLHATNNDLDQNTVADALASAQTLSQPYGVAFTEDSLIVSDTLNSRVLIYAGQ